MSATAQKIEKSYRGIARSGDLYRLEALWTPHCGLNNVPLTIRPWIYWFVALIKTGYSSVEASIGVITDAHRRSTGKTTQSKRSTYRALAWLTEHGYVRRRKLRRGVECHGVILDIQLEAFRFFTSVRPRSAPTIYVTGRDMWDNSLPVSNWHPDDLTNRSNQLRHTVPDLKDQSHNVPDQIHSKIKINSRKCAKHRYPAVAHTLWVILGKPSRSSRLGHLVRYAEQGIARGGARCCTVDWAYWSAKWPEMEATEREYHAKNSILPELVANYREFKGQPAKHKPTDPAKWQTVDMVNSTFAKKSTKRRKKLKKKSKVSNIDTDILQSICNLARGKKG